MQQIRKVVAFRYQSLDQASHMHYFVPSLKQSQEIGTAISSTKLESTFQWEKKKIINRSFLPQNTWPYGLSW